VRSTASIQQPVPANKKRRNAVLSWALLAALWLAVSVRAEMITVERESSLRAEPSLGAATVATVRKGTRGESLGKSGIWVNIKTPDASGWVFTFNIRFGERAASSGSDVAAAGRMVSRPSSGVVATIGIRGLSEEDLQKAAFNADEIRRLDGFAASSEASARRAQGAGLTAAKIDYLEEP
jgi:hypothetical protein